MSSSGLGYRKKYIFDGVTYFKLVSNSYTYTKHSGKVQDRSERYNIQEHSRKVQDREMKVVKCTVPVTTGVKLVFSSLWNN